MSEIVTAGVLVIGDEILSGRTKDKNIGFIAEYLTNIGIDLKEVRVVADEESDIVDALNALRNRYTYVFTTGGIGPTHDDITADSVAKAFGVGIDHHPEVVARFRERWTEQDLNEARLRMARVPDGAELIQSATILAPGFKLGNVIVMAGVPSIMQAMMDIVAPKLKSGVRMLSDSVRANAREGDIGGPLREIANAHPDTIIGSYPFQDEDKKPNTNLVVRSRDPEKLNPAMAAVKARLAHLPRLQKLGGGSGNGLLIVDDLVDTGKTGRLVRSMMPDAHFAAVYAKPQGKPLVDTFITEVSQDTWIHFPWDTALSFQPPIRP